MKEHPIPFRDDMVRALLAGAKSQTRRPVTPRNSVVGEGHVDWSQFDWEGKSIYEDATDWVGSPGPNHRAPLPFVDGKAISGQYLHVPWNWAENATIFRIYSRYEVGDRLVIKETAWCNSITLAITGIRIQHVQDISDDDALAEGVRGDECARLPGPHFADQASPSMCFAHLWESIYGKKHPWASNPWAWVYKFEVSNG